MSAPEKQPLRQKIEDEISWGKVGELRWLLSYFLEEGLEELTIRELVEAFGVRVLPEKEIQAQINSATSLSELFEQIKTVETS